MINLKSVRLVDKITSRLVVAADNDMQLSSDKWWNVTTELRKTNLNRAVKSEKKFKFWGSGSAQLGRQINSPGVSTLLAQDSHSLLGFKQSSTTGDFSKQSNAMKTSPKKKGPFPATNKPVNSVIPEVMVISEDFDTSICESPNEVNTATQFKPLEEVKV